MRKAIQRTTTPFFTATENISVRCVLGLPLTEQLLQALDPICFCICGDHTMIDIEWHARFSWLIVQKIVVKKSSSDPLADEDFLARKFIARKFLNTNIS